MRFILFGGLLLWLLTLLAGDVAGQARNPSPESGPLPVPPAHLAIAFPPDEGVTVAGPVPEGEGLQAAYYYGPPRGPAAHRCVDPEARVRWWGASPAAGVARQPFSVRWTGYLRAPETGLYVLHIEWDGAIAIRFAKKEITNDTGTDELDVVQYYKAGNFYRIEMTYHNTQGIPRPVLNWSLPSELKNPSKTAQAFEAHESLPITAIPAQFLYPYLPRSKSPAVVAPARPVPPQPVAKRPAAAPLLPNLAALGRGTAVALPNLYFAKSTADLLPASRPILNALAQELDKQPALRLKIAGHTDNVGDALLNLRLSRQRAGMVRRYLVQQGIDSLRLTTQGYGGAYPVADNRAPQQRPRNRRVEVIVQ